MEEEQEEEAPPPAKVVNSAKEKTWTATHLFEALNFEQLTLQAGGVVTLRDENPNGGGWVRRFRFSTVSRHRCYLLTACKGLREQRARQQRLGGNLRWVPLGFLVAVASPPAKRKK